MKRMILGFCLGLMVCSFAWGEESAAPAADEVPASKVLAIVAVGDIDPALMERLRSFAEENMAVKVNLFDPQTPVSGTLDEEGMAVAKLVTDDVAAMTAIVIPGEGVTSHGVSLPAQRVAVINARSLKPEDGDMEKYARRLERQVMRSLGMLVGMEPCPNPQCSLWTYGNNDELDMMGRNFCPPCLKKVQDLGRTKNLTIVKDSPFLIE